MTIKKMAYIHMPARNFLTSLASTTVPRVRFSESLWRGKSAIKRAAIIQAALLLASPLLTDSNFNSFAGTGFENRYPWPNLRPSARTRSSWS